MTAHRRSLNFKLLQGAERLLIWGAQSARLGHLFGSLGRFSDTRTVKAGQLVSRAVDRSINQIECSRSVLAIKAVSSDDDHLIKEFLREAV